MTWMIGISFIIVFIGIILIAIQERFSNKNFPFNAIGILGVFIGGLLLGLQNKPEIEPIDVYRGKTELKIRTVMENSVIIEYDSIVVLK